MSLKFILTNSLITLSLYSNDIIPRYEPYISPLSKNISHTQKGENKMPKNKFQDVIYTIIMASVMVYGMVAYNIVLNTGSMQNWVFLAVFHEWPIMTVIAILLELVFVGKLAMKVAFRLVNPREASQTSIMLAISAASVWLMCPCMSFFATLLFKDSHNAQFFAIWVQTTVMNFPMALLWQFFAAGPLVRRIFGLLFRDNADKSSATEMESV